MPAPLKQGLDFYPRDVNLINDVKFKRAKRKYGYLVYVVYDVILELVYSGKGYYLEYNSEVAEDIADMLTGRYPVNEKTVCEVIEMLTASGLFDGDCFEQGIVTSRRIQSVYYKCTVRRKEVYVDKKIWRLDLNEMKLISPKSPILRNFEDVDINEVNVDINGVNEVNYTLKEKESKKENALKGLKQNMLTHKEKENEGDINITEPDVKEIEEYCISNKLSVNSYEFWSYYHKRNWVAANGISVTDWRQKVTEWNERYKKWGAVKEETCDRREYNENELEEIFNKKAEE